MFNDDFEQQVIRAVREIVKDILKDEIKQDRRYNQTELCENLGIGGDTLSDLNKRGLRPTKVGRQYIYLESECVPYPPYVFTYAQMQLETTCQELARTFCKYN